MSGIAGIVRLDGGPMGPTEIGTMLGAMARRGPDAQRGWTGQQAAFGQVLLATTPEATVEVQPWVDHRAGCVVVSDSRLDNRPELLRALGLRETSPDDIGDGRLLLAAWEKWGEACAEQLLGDFAFAIWDMRRRVLFCARDIMGVRPFYYHFAPGRRFVLASETGAILTQPVARGLNEGRIADALVSELEGIDKTSTFFTAIARLPPACVLMLRDGRLSIRQYWHPLATPPSPMPRTDDEWVESAREVLKEAVRCRLRGSARVGSMLSGGVDSSSVVALADEILSASGGGRFPTFSAIDSQGGCSETAGIRTMLASRDLDATLIDVRDEDMVRQTARERLELLAEPFDGTMTLIDCVYRAAAQRGVRCVMDGLPADNLYSTAGQIDQLLQEWRFTEAYREAVFAHRESDRSSPRLRAAVTVAAHFAPAAWRQSRQRQRDRRWYEENLIERTLIARDYAHDVDLWKRYLTYRDDMSRHTCVDATGSAVTNLTSSYVAAAVERYGRVASSYGVEPRHPFLDRRVVEQHAWVPRCLRRKGVVYKWILRRALEASVPQSVIWSERRPHLGWRFNLCATRSMWDSSFASDGFHLEHRIDSTKAAAATLDLKRIDGGEGLAALHAAMLTSCWFQQPIL